MNNFAYFGLKSWVLAVAVCLTAASASARCGDRYKTEAMVFIEAFMKAQSPSLLKMTQIHLRDGMGYRDVTRDGMWGPVTYAALCGTLDGYTTIGGSGPNWGIRSTRDVPRFLTWIGQASLASQSDGAIEYPD